MSQNYNEDLQRQGYPVWEQPQQGGQSSQGSSETRRIDAPSSPAYPGGAPNAPASQSYTPVQPQVWNPPYPQAPQPPTYQPAPQQYQPQPQPQQYSQQPQVYQPQVQQFGPQYTPPQYQPQQVQYRQPIYMSTRLSNYEAAPIVRDTTLAMVIEIIAGLCMFLGIGHLLSGRVIPGLVLLIGYWVAAGFIYGVLGVMGIFTLGLGWLLIPAVWFGIPIISAFWLRQETERRSGRR